MQTTIQPESLAELARLREKNLSSCTVCSTHRNTRGLVNVFLEDRGMPRSTWPAEFQNFMTMNLDERDTKSLLQSAIDDLSSLEARTSDLNLQRDKCRREIDSPELEDMKLASSSAPTLPTEIFYNLPVSKTPHSHHVIKTWKTRSVLLIRIACAHS